MQSFWMSTLWSCPLHLAKWTVTTSILCKAICYVLNDGFSRILHSVWISALARIPYTITFGFITHRTQTQAKEWIIRFLHTLLIKSISFSLAHHSKSAYISVKMEKIILTTMYKILAISNSTLYTLHSPFPLVHTTNLPVKIYLKTLPENVSSLNRSCYKQKKWNIKGEKDHVGKKAIIKLTKRTANLGDSQ